MLHYVCLLALLTTQVLSTPRYVVELFEAATLTAYPIDICVITGLILGVKNIKYSCSDDGLTVTRSIYSTNTCAGNATSKSIITAANETESGLWQFNCNGTNDYIATKLYLSCAATAPLATVYTVTNLCRFSYDITNDTYDVYGKTDCNSTGALVKTFYSTGLCDLDSGDMEKNETFISSTTCGFYKKSGGYSVNAKLGNCVYNGYTQFPVTNSTEPNIGETSQLVNLSLSLTASASATVDPDLCGLDWYTVFTSAFNESYVQITTTCQSNEGYGFAGIDIAVYVEVSSDASFQVDSCSDLMANITDFITAVFSGGADISSAMCSAVSYTEPTTTDFSSTVAATTTATTTSSTATTTSSTATTTSSTATTTSTATTAPITTDKAISVASANKFSAFVMFGLLLLVCVL